MLLMMRRKNQLYLVLFLFVGITVVSCNKKNEFEERELQQISEFLENNPALSFEKKPSGLYYMEQIPGTGIVPIKFDTAYVRYTGKFLDGTIFDSNIGTSTPLMVLIGSPSIIQGFNEGLTYMKSGGKSLILLPSSLGYGSIGNYYGGISGYTPLLFEIQLVLVKPGKGHK